MPDTVTINATGANGEPYYEVVPVHDTDVIPVRKVFLRQRLDLLTAKAWLDEQINIHDQVVELSCNESMPTAHTLMVCYPRQEDPKKDPNDQQTSLLGDNSDDSDGFVGASSKNDRHKKDKEWYKNKKTLLALTGGGGIVVGAVAYSFGDLAASMGNVALGSEVDGLCDCECDCGNCDCDCGDCIC